MDSTALRLLVDLDPTFVHRHGRACWWDHEQARWVCGTRPERS